MLGDLFRKVAESKKKWAGQFLAPTFFILCFSSCDLVEALKPNKGPKATVAHTNAAAEPNVNFKTAAEKYRFHRWLIKEMYEQIYGRPLKDLGAVDGWANVLSQRGSIEGVYHGLVLSTDYTALEKGTADLKALRFFSLEMAMMEHPNSPEDSDQIIKSAESFAKEFRGAPLFTLKRTMGERVLLETTKRKEDSEGLAAWYAPIAGRWSKTGVPFGHEFRDKPDEAFHFRWAKENSLGMIQWEVLNRVHRVLNSFGGLPAIPAGK